ncbi:hypothetical protein COO60DRAFT_1513177 [Scenedesmus sp. NREL 46B-D3]|nr:hypothetical protein COO60DRAFT_1513177 [Scenedesmus sp. NREL 46B-D3]
MLVLAAATAAVMAMTLALKSSGSYLRLPAGSCRRARRAQAYRCHSSSSAHQWQQQHSGMVMMTRLVTWISLRTSVFLLRALTEVTTQRCSGQVLLMRSWSSSSSNSSSLVRTMLQLLLPGSSMASPWTCMRQGCHCQTGQEALGSSQQTSGLMMVTSSDRSSRLEHVMQAHIL